MKFCVWRFYMPVHDKTIHNMGFLSKTNFFPSRFICWRMIKLYIIWVLSKMNYFRAFYMLAHDKTIYMLAHDKTIHNMGVL